MSRSDRLLRLLHAIRTFPQPVTAAVLAEETGVSERTLYRDIDSLRAAGALIDGAPGYGYCLTEDPSLPPQTFSQLEIEALVLGLGYVHSRGDAALADAGQAALSKISATLPERLQRQVLHAVLRVHRWHVTTDDSIDLTPLRQACWIEQALDLVYRSADEVRTERRILPLSLVYLETAGSSTDGYGRSTDALLVRVNPECNAWHQSTSHEREERAVMIVPAGSAG